MNNFCVYHHINPLTREVFYVGKGLPYRPYGTDNRNRHWNNYVKKHSFEVVIVTESLSNKDAEEWEILWIEHFGRKNIGTGNLVNMTPGGDGGWEKGKKHSKERNAKISAAAKANPRRGENATWYGKHHSDISRKKISIGHKGLPSPNKGVKMTHVQKEKISRALKGRISPMKGTVRPAEVGENIRKSIKNRLVKVKCPHCDKEGIKIAMQRWHFNNCKNK